MARFLHYYKYEVLPALAIIPEQAHSSPSETFYAAASAAVAAAFLAAAVAAVRVILL